jgi:hypothetical protein
LCTETLFAMIANCPFRHPFDRHPGLDTRQTYDLTVRSL